MRQNSTTVTTHGEFSLIFNFFNSVTNQQRIANSAYLELGIGDDCAIFTPTAFIDKKLVVSTDTLIEGTHFFNLENFSECRGAYLAGYRSMVASLSDLAAMGAKPIAVTLAYSNNLNAEIVQNFCDGMNTILDLYQIPLMGGDTTAGGDKLTLTVTVFGVVERIKLPHSSATTLHALQRDQAKVGDLICVTDTKLGAANQALRRLYSCLADKETLPEQLEINELTNLKFNWFNFASNWSGIQQQLYHKISTGNLKLPRLIVGTDLLYRNSVRHKDNPSTNLLEILNHQLKYYFPLPKLNLGNLILPYAKCGQDISDGLLQDLKHILTASRVNAELWLDCFPLANNELSDYPVYNLQLEELFTYCKVDQDQAKQSLTQLRNFLTSAEEYQLIFTISPQHYVWLQQKLAQMSQQEKQELGLETSVITAIGQISEATLANSKQVSYKFFPSAPTLRSIASQSGELESKEINHLIEAWERARQIRMKSAVDSSLETLDLVNLTGLDYPLSKQGIIALTELIINHLFPELYPISDNLISSLQQYQEGYFLTSAICSQQDPSTLTEQKLQDLAEIWQRIVQHYLSLIYYSNANKEEDHCNANNRLSLLHSKESEITKPAVLSSDKLDLVDLFPVVADFAQDLNEEILVKLSNAPGLAGWNHR